MIKNALSVSVMWIIKHPLRYILSWGSFAVVFLFMIILISFGKSATAGNDENNLSAKILVIGSHSRSMYNNAFLPADYNQMKKTYEGLSYVDERAFLEVSCSGVSLNEKSIDNELIRVWRYHASEELLFEAEKRASKAVLPHNGKAVLINSSFINKHGLSERDVVGKEIDIYGIVDINRKNEVKNELYIVDAVVDTTNTFLGEADIFIPFEKDEIDDFLVDRVDIELATVEDFISAKRHIYEQGYILSTLNDVADYGEEFSRFFSKFGFGFGVVLFLMASVGMANTIAETLESNKAFFKMMYMVGCKTAFLYYVIILTTVIQGVIGALIGVLLSYILTPVYPKIIEYIMGFYYGFVKYSVHIGWESLLGVFSFCIIFSLLCGIMVCIVLKARSVFSFEMKSRVSIEEASPKKEIMAMIVKTLVIVGGIQFARVLVNACLGGATGDKEVITALCMSGLIVFLSVLIIEVQKRTGTAEHSKGKLQWNLSKDGTIYTLVCFCGFRAVYLCVMDILCLFNLSADVSEQIMLLTPAMVITSVAVFGVWGAAAEELWFRGAVLNVWRNKYPYAGIIIASVLFAGFHGEIRQKVVTFFLGLVLGYLGMKYRSVIYSFIMHALWNTVVIVNMWIRDKNPFGNPMPVQTTKSIMAHLIICGLVGWACIRYIVKKEQKRSIT